jgi:hypothetical protein
MLGRPEQGTPSALADVSLGGGAQGGRLGAAERVGQA